MRYILTLFVLFSFSAKANDEYVNTDIEKANSVLTKSGWKPLPLQCEYQQDKEQYWRANDASRIYEKGITSVHSCQGTGNNYCSFYYIRLHQCKKLVTSGEFAYKGLKGLIVKRAYSNCPEQC